MEWMVAINDLNPQQVKILDELSNNRDTTHWISGYAGTGKTIVIAHAIERLISRTRTASICFLTYTHALKDLVRSGLSASAANRVNVETIDSFRSRESHYDYILVDEIQDVTEVDIERIFRRADHVIAAGDPEQSIYLGRVDKNQLRQLLGGAKRHTLKHIHRLTWETFQLATAILPDAEVVTGALVQKGEGGKAKMIKAASKDEEFTKVYEEAVRVSARAEPSAILFPTHDQIYSFALTIAAGQNWGAPPVRTKGGPVMSYESFNEFFARKRAPLRFLGSNNGSLPESDNVRLVYLMTYHSAKGLDFNNIFLPDLRTGVRLDAKAPPFSSEHRERRHFFVAITRSRENVYFSYHGTPHKLLAELPPDCVEPFRLPRRAIAA